MIDRATAGVQYLGSSWCSAPGYPRSRLVLFNEFPDVLLGDAVLVPDLHRFELLALDQLADRLDIDMQ